MWRDEQPHVRDKYFNMASEIKDRLLLEHPDYRYNPRRSQDIRRRVSPYLKIKLLNYDNNGNLLWGTVDPEDTAIIRSHFYGVVRIEEMDEGCRIVCRPVAGSRRLRAAEIPTYMPRYEVDATPITDDNIGQGFNFNDPFPGADFPVNDHLWVAMNDAENFDADAPGPMPNPDLAFGHPGQVLAANEPAANQVMAEATLDPALITTVPAAVAALHMPPIPANAIITPSANGNAVHVSTPNHPGPGYILLTSNWTAESNENMNTED